MCSSLKAICRSVPNLIMCKTFGEAKKLSDHKLGDIVVRITIITSLILGISIGVLKTKLIVAVPLAAILSLLLFSAYVNLYREGEKNTGTTDANLKPTFISMIGTQTRRLIMLPSHCREKFKEKFLDPDPIT